jgi:hypothetical protein
MRQTLQKGLIVLLVLTAAVGSAVLSVRVGGITVYPFRLLVLAVLLAAPLLQYRLSWLSVEGPRVFAFVGFVWLVWGGCSVFWSPSFAGGVEDVFAVGFGFAVGVALLTLGAAQVSSLRWLRRGWVLAFLVTGAVAIWELVTGNHLPGAYAERAPEYALRSIAISTFGNPNNYGAFLVLCLPFLLHSRQQTSSLLGATFYEVLLVLFFGILFMTGSRSAFLGAVVEMGVLVFFFGAVKRGLALLGMGGALLVGLFYAGFSFEDLQILSSLQVMVSASAFEQGSLQARLGLTLNGVWMLLSTLGIGVGAGGYELVARSPDLPYYTSGLVNPHNFWIEVVSEYGILVGGLFVWMMGLFFLRSLQAYWARKGVWAQTALLMLVGYFFAALANSTYMAQPTNWMAIASIMCIVSALEKRRDEQTPQEREDGGPRS